MPPWPICAKPLDEALIVELAAEHDYLVTIEENAVQGGAGSAVLEVLAKHKIPVKSACCLIRLARTHALASADAAFWGLKKKRR